jgi:hypothetical protein
MAEPGQEPTVGTLEDPPVGRRKRRGRIGLATVFSLSVAAVVFFVLALALTGRSIPVPDAIRSDLQDRINARLEGAPLSIGGIEFGVARNGVPQVLMTGLRLADPQGGAVAELNWLGAELSFERLLRGVIAPERIYLTGAQITVRRTADGSFTLAAGQGIGEAEQSVADILAEVDGAMAEGALARLTEVVAGGVVITLEDPRTGRIWQATNASATLRRDGDAVSLSVTSDVFNGTDDLAGLQLSLTRSRTTGRLQLGATVTGMPAADIAVQSPILSWLGVLDAPISGAFRTEIDTDGTLRSFAGTLDFAAGALRPTASAPPVAFRQAKAYFTFDPRRERLDFSQVTVAAEEGSLTATGHTYLAEFDGLWPRAYLGQFRVDRLEYAGGDTFDGPVTLEDVRADLRLRLDPFTLEFGQIVASNEGSPILARGRVAADETGWHASVDMATERIGSDRVMTFWPKRVSPITRGWLKNNLSEGILVEPAFAIRFDTGKQPDVAFSFEFEDGTARFLPQMPPLTGAAGRAGMQGKRFALELREGGLTSPTGDWIDAAGSRFAVPDVRPKPTWGEIDVAASGRLEAILTVLDRPPLRLMSRAERRPDIAEANAETRALVRLPLKDGIDADEVTYDVTARLTEVTSDQLVPGRVFTSPELTLAATPEGIGLDGSAALDGVPLTASWRQPLGEGVEDGGRITGEITLSAAAVETFDLPLPEGLVAGEGRADYVLTLPRDETPSRLELRSDLAGLTMGFDALGWRKVAGQTGRLDIAATLGTVPEIETIELDAPGLAMEGQLALGQGGALEKMSIKRLRVGSWLDAEVELLPGANGGPPRVSVLGGTLDIRQLDLGGKRSGGSTGPIDLRLDRLTISDGIAFAPFNGRIEPTPQGLSGRFEARLNGGTPVRGTLAPANAGTAIRIQSDGAGGVLRDAGLTPNAREGTLDLVLTPVVGAPAGTFDGQFLIENIRLKDAPAMAELLDAISVVGLLDQLAGPGIRFSTIDGQFRLDRRKIQLKQAAAVGTSMGISADGVFDLRTDLMDFRGVVSPVYFLNGIGSVLTRRGEGLFGFNYRMAGPAKDPSVSVNPLSILTPGAFRQIFRRPPPGG